MAMATKAVPKRVTRRLAMSNHRQQPSASKGACEDGGEVITLSEIPGNLTGPSVTHQYDWLTMQDKGKGQSSEPHSRTTDTALQPRDTDDVPSPAPLEP